MQWWPAEVRNMGKYAMLCAREGERVHERYKAASYGGRQCAKAAWYAWQVRQSGTQSRQVKSGGTGGVGGARVVYGVGLHSRQEKSAPR